MLQAGKTPAASACHELWKYASFTVIRTFVHLGVSADRRPLWDPLLLNLVDRAACSGRILASRRCTYATRARVLLGALAMFYAERASTMLDCGLGHIHARVDQTSFTLWSRTWLDSNAQPGPVNSR